MDQQSLEDGTTHMTIVELTLLDTFEKKVTEMQERVNKNSIYEIKSDIVVEE